MTSETTRSTLNASDPRPHPTETKEGTVALESQRFRANRTLNACVDSGYRLMAGDSDRDAITRLQIALVDLGYLPTDGFSAGTWEASTSSAVVSFKTEEGLSPTDPVVSRGTMGQLDGYFAWEPDDPDRPDPTTSGLLDLAAASAADAAAYARIALDRVGALAWGDDILDPADDALRSALRAHLGIETAVPDDPTAAELSRSEVTAVLEAVERLFTTGGFIRFTASDRVEWQTATNSQRYWCVQRTPGATLLLTPAFRNALDDVDRVALLLRLGMGYTTPWMHALGYPGTARYGYVPGSARRSNSAGWSAFICYTGNGITDPVRPQPIWDISE